MNGITIIFGMVQFTLIHLSFGDDIYFFGKKITHWIKCNNVYAFNIGYYIIWVVVANIGYIVDYIRSYNLKILRM